MQDLKKVMGWVFAISIFPSLWMAYRIVRYIHRTHHTLDQPRSLAIAAFFPLMACIYAAAWWAYWRGRPSARWWGIAACLTYVLMAFVEVVTFRRHWGSSACLLTVGVAGLILFLSRGKAEPVANPTKISANS